MKSWLLRRAELADFDAVAAIRKQAMGGDYFKNTFDEERVNPHYYFTVLELAGQLIGYAVVELTPPDAVLCEVAVRPEWRRQGWASKMWKDVRQTARQRKVKRIFLELRESNVAALAWYKTLGFMEINRRQSYYSDPQEDGIIMKLTV